MSLIETQLKQLDVQAEQAALALRLGKRSQFVVNRKVCQYCGMPFDAEPGQYICPGCRSTRAKHRLEVGCDTNCWMVVNHTPPDFDA